MSWTQEGTLAGETRWVTFCYGNDKLEISKCHDKALYPLSCLLYCNDEQQVEHAMSVLLPIYPSLRRPFGSSIICLVVEQWTTTFVREMTTNLVKAFRNGTKELHSMIEAEFKKFGRFAPWDTHRERKNNIWCHVYSFRNPSTQHTHARECMFTTSLPSSAIKEFSIIYKSMDDVNLFVEVGVYVRSADLAAVQVKPDYWRVDCKLHDVPDIIQKLCQYDTTGCLLPLLEKDLQLLHNMTLKGNK